VTGATFGITRAYMSPVQSIVVRFSPNMSSLHRADAVDQCFKPVPMYRGVSDVLPH
jgi:hypothetical protein